MKGDSEDLGPDSDEGSRMKAALRFASVVLPSLATGMALLLCWRRHFVAQSILGAGVEIAGSVYIAIFFYRRSRGQSARIFYSSTGPDQDQDSQDQTDIGALLGAAIYAGILAYALIEFW
jgi:hypothetical protein